MNNIHTTYELRSILCYAMYAHHLVATRTDGEELSADWAKVYNTTPLSLKITLACRIYSAINQSTRKQAV